MATTHNGTTLGGLPISGGAWLKSGGRRFVVATNQRKALPGMIAVCEAGTMAHVQLAPESVSHVHTGGAWVAVAS